MTDPGQAGSSLVTLLVPHSGRTAVLVADREGFPPATPPRLPTVRLNTAEPKVFEILDCVDVVDTSKTVPLRLVVTSDDDASDTAAVASEEVSLMLEFDPSVTEAPTGWVWQDLDAEVIARLEPATSRAALASWARERAEGWSPLRPQWSRPRWFADASAWMLDQMEAAGQPAIGTPRPHQLWGPSVVLRAPSTDGDVFFKCSAEIFRNEAVATQALSTRVPELVPEVIAVDDARGWLLMRDLDARELGDQDQSLWHEGVVAHAVIQQSWLGRTDELVALGLPVRSLTDLASQTEALAEDDEVLKRMTADVRRRWRATAPTMADSCRRLDEIGPEPTLVHGDLHPWNVAFGPASTRVFDWTDAAVSHPFVDLVTYVSRTEDIALRRRLIDAYVGAWSAMYPEEALRDAAALAPVVGALYQVQTYRALLPTLARRGADDGLAAGDLNWIKRSLTCFEHGLESPAFTG